MSTPDDAGRLPIHYAAFDDDPEGVRASIASGEPVDAQDLEGFTPLHLAAQQYAVSAAEALLQAGAAVDPTNRFGNSPLFVAVANSNGRGGVIQLLRSHGADPGLANLSGQTPLGFARLIGNYDVKQYFADLD